MSLSDNLGTSSTWQACSSCRVACSQVLWDAETGHPICGTPTANNFTNAARFFSQHSLCIATGGNYNLTVWEYNIPGNKLVPHEVQLGQMRRIVTCLDIDQDDQYMYCGTTTGDVLQAGLPHKSCCCCNADTIMLGRISSGIAPGTS